MRWLIYVIDLSFVETSAYNASNVETAFKQIITEIFKLTEAGKFDHGYGVYKAGAN